MFTKSNRLIDALGAWNLNEGDGLIAYDESENGHNGQIDPRAIWKQDTYFGDTVLDLSETGARVLITQPDFQFGSEYTLSAWIKTSQNRETYKFILCYGLNGEDGSFNLSLAPQTGTLTYTAPGVGSFDSGQALDDGLWHQVAVEVNNQTLSIWIDGNRSLSAPVEGQIPSLPAGDFCIGSAVEEAFYLEGKIAQVRVYPRAVLAMNIDGKHAKPTPAACWMLNEGFGEVANDSSNNWVNGTIQNAAWVEDEEFGWVLDFSPLGSLVTFPSAGAYLKENFTISCWVKAMPMRDTLRILLSMGNNSAFNSLNFKFEAETGEVTFYSPSISGATNSGFAVDDNQWHHVMLTYKNYTLRFYLDGNLTTTQFDYGTMPDSLQPIYLGGLSSGDFQYTGYMSQVCIYTEAISPFQVEGTPPPGGLPYQPGAGWNLNLSSGDTIPNVVPGGASAIVGDATWQTDDLFSQVLLFSNPLANVSVTDSSLSFVSDFAMAAWIKVEVSNIERTIISRGTANTGNFFSINLSAQGQLFVVAPALTGDMNGGFDITNDSVFHHILVVKANNLLSFYLDGILMKHAPVTGNLPSGDAEIIIGNNSNRDHVFGGLIAQVRAYQQIVWPLNVTNLSIPPAVPVTGQPNWTHRHGVVFDRRQDDGTVPPTEIMLIHPEEVAEAAGNGFDHIKLLFNPVAFMNLETGALLDENMWYIDDTVNMVLSGNLGCVICIHPDGNFKPTFLGDWQNFELLLRFYTNLAEHINQLWAPADVALQLMTEPFANAFDWNGMYPRMWAAARKSMPEHTIILSGDSAGYMLAVMNMRPVNDSNVYYSFTTYEPYEFGFNALKWQGVDTWWHDVGPIPYPATPEIIAQRLPELIANVPVEFQPAAIAALENYGAANYNQDWMFNRMEMFQAFSEQFGGNLRYMSVEYGCLDPVIAATLEGPIVLENERVNFIHDWRNAYDTYNCGWCYWSFNETFTLLNPYVRIPFQMPNDWSEWRDLETLNALGLQ